VDETRVVRSIGEIVPREMTGEGVRDVLKRVLISPAEGWQGWVMRLFEIAPGGHTPRHAHDWPHVNFIAAGRGELHLDGQDFVIETGSAAFVPAGVVHQFSSTGGEPLSFVCIVPEHGDV
jgi:quercetin dioxygenase-like cupin family protein